MLVRLLAASSRLSALALLSACAASPPPADDGRERRRPDGVAVDPLAYPPEPTERAEARDGVVTLRTPLGVDAARDTATTFLNALTREDAETLRQRLTPDALSVNPSTRGRENAFYFFTRRFARLEYQFLINASFYQDEQLQLFRAGEGTDFWADLVGPSAIGAGAPGQVSDALEPGDVVVVVPVSVTRSGTAQLFGEELTLLLRRSGGRYLVHRVVEDFALPP